MNSMLREKDPVKAALTYVDPKLDDTSKLRKELDVLSERRDNLLGMESDARTVIDKRITELQERLDFATAADPKVPYSRIDLRDPLRWRKRRQTSVWDTGVAEGPLQQPQLVPWRLDSPTTMFRNTTHDVITFEIGAPAVAVGVLAVLGVILAFVNFAWYFGVAAVVAGIAAVIGTIEAGLRLLRRKRGVFPRMPQVLASCYNDVIREISVSPTRPMASHTAHFRGVIPDKVKANIAKAREIFGDEIFIIGEPNSWSSTVKEAVNLDPLVVGVRDDVCYLIDSFDLTPLERAVALEYTD